MEIDILNKAIFIVDYEQNNLKEIDSKGDFDEYIKGLINDIKNNELTRLYNIRSDTTEVIACTKRIINLYDDSNKQSDTFKNDCKIIANKLLNEEVKMQKKINRLGTSIKKGSLIEVLLYDSENKIYSFLVAKVEHKSYYDDENFNLRTGYSTDNNKLWKRQHPSWPFNESGI